MASQTALVTGNAGFIGFHTVSQLLESGTPVVGVDVVNDYYDVSLKENRLAQLDKMAQATGTPYTFIRGDLADAELVAEAVETASPSRVIHLAAQAGVRHSLEAPHDYVQSNVVAFLNILEACRAHQTPHLTYASTSSVYGANTTMPFSEHDGVNHPLQFYAATKRANELMAHSYSHLFGIPTTALRFFTVYGPWGRPDMSPFLFAKAILAGDPLKLFNNGNHSRDFTYVGDIVEGVIRASDTIAAPNPDWNPANPDPASSNAPYRVYNIGSNAPVKLMDFIAALEKALGKKGVYEKLPLQPGDVPDSHADASELVKATGYKPDTPLEEGVAAFAEWYREYYRD